MFWWGCGERVVGVVGAVGWWGLIENNKKPINSLIIFCKKTIKLGIQRSPITSPPRLLRTHQTHRRLSRILKASRNLRIQILNYFFSSGPSSSPSACCHAAAWRACRWANDGDRGRTRDFSIFHMQTMNFVRKFIWIQSKKEWDFINLILISV